MIFGPTVGSLDLAQQWFFDRAVRLQNRCAEPVRGQVSKRRKVVPRDSLLERRGRTIDRKRKFYKSVFEYSQKVFQCVFFIASFTKKH